MYEDDVTPSWFLFWWYLHNLVFSGKNNPIPKMLPMWDFVPLKFQQNFEIFADFANFEINVPDPWFLPKQQYSIHSFPKNVKFHFWFVFWAISQFYQQFIVRLCVKMMWAQLDFFSGNIYNFVFSDKKNSNSKNFANIFFCGPKVSTKF